MFPNSAEDNFGNKVLSYAIVVRYLLLGNTASAVYPPNLQNLFRRQFVAVGRFSASKARAISGYAITSIFQVIARPQVRWVAAWRVVAGVKNIQTVWDRPFINAKQNGWLPCGPDTALRPKACASSPPYLCL